MRPWCAGLEPQVSDCLIAQEVGGRPAHVLRLSMVVVP